MCACLTLKSIHEQVNKCDDKISITDVYFTNTPLKLTYLITYNDAYTYLVSLTLLLLHVQYPWFRCLNIELLREHWRRHEMI